MPHELIRRTDADLMARCRDGDHAAFAVLVDRHRALVTSVARGVAGASAEDVAQQTFLSAWLSCERYDPTRGSVPSWLCGIARNRAIDALRAERRRPVDTWLDDDGTADLVCPVECPSETAHRRVSAAAVRRALGTLGTEQRTVLTLAYFGGLSQSEIQDRVQVPLGTVKGRARLGLQALRVQLAA